MKTNNPAVAKPHQDLGHAYCPICTHTVQVNITFAGKHARVTPGQKCPRCNSSIDAGYVIRMDRAA